MKKLNCVQSKCIALLAGLLVGLTAPYANAQDYPARPVRVVLPGAPGSLFDTITRMVFSKVSEALGQPVTIENAAGAGGVIGVASVARAPADGYTLMSTPQSALTVAPLLQLKPGYDPVRDFEPVAMLAQISEVLVVHPSLGVKTLEDFVRLAKTQPGKIAYASAGNGHVQHLFMELFQRKAGIQLLHVPYKGVPPALQAVLSGEVGAINVGMGLARGHIASGKLVALAKTDYPAQDALPGVPALTTQYPDAESIGWLGVFAPKGTPKEVVAKLNAEIAKALALPDVKARLASLDLHAVGGSPGDLDQALRKDIAVNRELVTSIGLKAD